MPKGIYQRTPGQKKQLIIQLSQYIGLEGSKNPMYGNPRQKDIRERISEKLKGRYAGDKNPFWGKSHSEEVRAKIRLKRKEQIISEETRKKISIMMKGKFAGEKHPMWGKHHSPETLLKLSKSQKEEKHWAWGTHLNAERCKQMAASMKGKHLSRETRLKMSESSKRENLSIETRNKLSESHKGERNHFHRDIYTGENNPRWLGGKSFEPYTTEWRRELKESIRDRDGHECCLCNIPENGRKHHAHHIDYDKKNCHPINLITLCNQCHPKTNTNRNYWTNYFRSLMGHIATNMSSCVGSNVDNVELQMH